MSDKEIIARLTEQIEDAAAEIIDLAAEALALLGGDAHGQ